MEYRVEIGGEPVILRYTVNSMCAMEDLAGGTLEQVVEACAEGMRRAGFFGAAQERAD